MWSLLFLRNEHNLFPLSNVCICQSDSTAASVFIDITAFGHSFPVHEEENEYKHGKKCSDQRTLGCLVKTWMFLPKRSLALVTSCSAMWTYLCFQPMELSVAVGLCVELPWVLSPHSILPSFFPLLSVHCHAAWTLFSHWRGAPVSSSEMAFLSGFQYIFFLKP